MKSDENVTEIRLRMRQIRGGLREDVEGIRTHARRLTDWRYYLVKFPWASIAAAAAVGYLVIPKRPKIVQADAKTLAQMARDHNFVVQSVQNDTQRKGVMAMLGSALAATAMQYGKSYASTQLQQFVRNAAGGKTSTHSAAGFPNGRRSPY